ncbi:MAG TPA: beta-1,3-glucanase family protein [Polyangia bacterium]|nr:beta-1,3-glucanase family protein [Polyangia bacterium]
MTKAAFRFGPTARGRCACAALGVVVVMAQGCEQWQAGGGQPGAPAAVAAQPLAAAACPPTGGGGATGADGGFVINIPDPPTTPVMPVAGNGVSITNNCDIPIAVRVQVGGSATDTDFMLAPGANHVYALPNPTMPGGWIEAHEALPVTDANLLERVMITIVRGNVLSKVEHQNGIALPIEVYGVGGGTDCGKRTGCFVPRKKIMTDCPDGLLVGIKCVAPGVYCADPANQAKPVCHALDAAVAACAAKPECAAAATLTSKQAYNCDKFFGTSYKWCAAINRGMLDSADSTDATQFYTKPPYNNFSAWVHSFCHTWAFPYDDFNGAPADDTYRACRQGSSASVTFCPNG